MFLLGFIAGIVWVFIGILIIREVIFRFGKQISSKIENDIARMHDATIQTTIIYPDTTKEIFNKEESNLEDLLQ